MAQAKSKGKKSRSPAPVQPAKTPVPAAGGVRAPAHATIPLRIAWAALQVLVFLVPIAITNLTWTGLWVLPLSYDQFDIAKIFVMRAMTLVAAAGWAWHVLVKGGSVRFVRKGSEASLKLFAWFEFAVLAMLTWLALTTLTSIHPPTALFGKYRRFEGLVSFVNYAVVFFLVVQLADRPSRIRSMLRTLFFSNLIVSGYAVMQYFGSASMGVATGVRTGSAVAALLLGLISGALWLLFDDGSVERKRLARFLAVLGGMALTGAVYMGAVISNAVKRGLTEVSLDIIQWGNLPFEAHRGFSTYGNPDLLGGFLVFPLIICIGLALSEADWRWRGLYWSGSIITAVAWVTAFVRGAWIGGAVGLVIFAVVVWRSGIKPRKVDWVFVALATVALVAVVGVSLRNTTQVLNVGHRLASITKFDEGSALTRTQIWQAALDAVKERPVQGWGLDTFRLLFPKFKPYEYVEAAGYLSVADNVHNYPLQLASGVGILGFLLVYGTIFAAAWMSLPTAFSRGGGEMRLLQGSVWAACAAYIVHLVFGLSVTGSTVFLWLCMGLLLSPLATATTVSPPRWGVFAAASTLALCAVLIIGNIVYFVADHHYLRARIASGGPERVRSVETAIRLNPTNDMYRAELGLAHQDMAVAAVFKGREAQDAGKDATPYYQEALRSVQDAEAAFKSVIEFVPTEYDNYVFIANLYNFAADYMDPAYRAKAEEWARKGVEVEPFGPAVRYQLAAALVGQERLEEAEKEIVDALAMDFKYPEAWALLGDIRVRLGRDSEAVEDYLQAIRFRGTDQQLKEAGDAAVKRALIAGAGSELEAHFRSWVETGYPIPWAAWHLGRILQAEGGTKGLAEMYRGVIATQTSYEVTDPDTLAKLQQALAALEGAPAQE